jgi:hypothetical protein
LFLQMRQRNDLMGTARPRLAWNHGPWRDWGAMDKVCESHRPRRRN